MISFSCLEGAHTVVIIVTFYYAGAIVSKLRCAPRTDMRYPHVQAMRLVYDDALHRAGLPHMQTLFLRSFLLLVKIKELEYDTVRVVIDCSIYYELRSLGCYIGIYAFGFSP